MSDQSRGRPSPLIRLGDRGSAVRDVQRRLQVHVRESLEADGVFGPDTRDAVRDFQRLRGLPADGIVGPETWRSLIEAGFRLGDRLLWHSAVLMRGDDVLELQQRLNQLGFDAGAEDGLYGRLTRTAVEELQRNIGLTVDGVAGPATIESLRRLHRSHQAPGLAARVREREALRHLSNRGLPGTRLLVDPAFGPLEPGPEADGVAAHHLTWEIASRVAARMSALGVDATLSRGPRTTPTGSERARLANELGVHAVLSISVNAHRNPVARGPATYYFGGERFVSEGGQALAELTQEAVTGAGWEPDCRVHRMTWAILRETRMTAVVVEPGFLTSPVDRARLVEPGPQDGLAAALTGAVARFFEAGARP